MILHDTCSIEYYEKTSGTPIAPHVVTDVPCELTPLTSAKNEDTGFVSTDYLFVTTFDLNTYWRETLGANTHYTGLRVKYRGDSLQIKAGFEVHRVLGRFHHIEAIAADFGRFSTVQ